MRRLTSRSRHESCLNPAYPTRHCQCPHCRAEFEAALRAVTLKCPNCARPIQFQDVVFHRSSAESLTTLGSVRITRRGSVQGHINCDELHVEGAMHGTMRVRGRATIGNKATINGSLRTRALTIEAGARLRGYIEIGLLNEETSSASADTAR